MTVERPEWFAIGTAERDTGIGRDTLRMWERRYGFPTPVRNDKGERVYSGEQIRRLQLIRRLLDRGLRPGKVVPLDAPALNALAATPPGAGAREVVADVARLLTLAAEGDLTGLEAALEQALAREGLRGFVLHTFAPLSVAVGERWAQGQLQIFEEHLLSGQLAAFIAVAMNRIGRPPGDPEVVLATLPGERHGLGLSMVEALLWHEGRATLNLGTEVPVDQLLAAVQRSGARTVALSFSACYSRTSLRADITELAARLPPGTALWVGGAGAQGLRRLPPAVVKKSLESL